MSPFRLRCWNPFNYHLFRLWNGIFDVMKKTNHYTLKWAYIFWHFSFLNFIARNWKYQKCSRTSNELCDLIFNLVAIWIELFFCFSILRIIHIEHMKILIFFCRLYWAYSKRMVLIITINLYTHIERVSIWQLHFFQIFLCIFPSIWCFRSLCLFL